MNTLEGRDGDGSPRSENPVGLVRKMWRKGQKCVHAIREWIPDYGKQALNQLCLLGLGALSIVVTVSSQGVRWLFSLTGIVFAVFVVGGVWTTILTTRGVVRVSQLQRDLDRNRDEKLAVENRSQQMEGVLHEAFETLLEVIATRLQFSHQDRVSVYKHDGESFVMIGRFAKDPVLKKPNRTTYPDDEGCIAVAWRQGSCHLRGLPNPDSHGFTSYQNKLLKQQVHITEPTFQIMRMKSRNYVGRCLSNAHGHPIAVIVFESTATDRLLYEKIEEVLDDEYRRLLPYLEGLEPRPMLARDAGY